MGKMCKFHVFQSGGALVTTRFQTDERNTYLNAIFVEVLMNIINFLLPLHGIGF